MRHDEHRPSTIIPADYEYVAEEFMRIEDLGDSIVARLERERITEHMQRTGGTYAQVETTGNCMVCGSVNAIYTSLFYHAKSNTYVRMGHDCADKCEMGGAFQRSTFRKKMEDARHYQAGKQKAKALLSDAGALAAWDIFAADFDALPRDPSTARPERTAKAWDGTEEVIPAYPGRLYYEEETIRDIVSKLVKYGSISEAAMKLVKDLTERIPDRDKRNAERAAERAAEKAAAKPAPTGRVKIEGTVLKVEDRETDFGVRTVMTVKTADGWIAWGSVPSGITVERDCKVVFVATVEPSERDDKFAFFKRPVLYVSPEEKKARKAAQKAEGTI